MTLLTHCNLFVNVSSSFVTLPTIPIMDTLQKTIHDLASDPFTVAITFQLPDFLYSSLVCTCCLAQSAKCSDNTLLTLEA